MTELLNKKATAAILGVSPLSINRLMPEIGFVRLGKRRVMFKKESVLAYIESKSVPPRPRGGNSDEK